MLGWFPAAGGHPSSLWGCGGVGRSCSGNLCFATDIVEEELYHSNVDDAVDCPVEVPAWFMGLCGFLGDLPDWTGLLRQ